MTSQLTVFGRTISPEPMNETALSFHYSRNRANQSCLTEGTKRVKLPGIKKIYQSVDFSAREYINVASKLEKINTAADYKLPVRHAPPHEFQYRYTLPKDNGNKFSFMGTVAMHANATMRPGAYNPEMTDPQRIGNKSPKEIRDSYIGKTPRKTFCDDIGKLKKFIPSPA